MSGSADVPTLPDLQHDALGRWAPTGSERRITAALAAAPRGTAAFTIPCRTCAGEKFGEADYIPEPCTVCAGAGVLPVGVLRAPGPDVECDGGPCCMATMHIHGCYAERPARTAPVDEEALFARQLYEALGAVDDATPGGIMLMPWMAAETKAVIQAAIDAWEHAHPAEAAE